ncbi:hemerythrin [Microbispora sp. GKU 823]|nr:hemerythrin [Microbispora sp. GKU 823]
MEAPKPRKRTLARSDDRLMAFGNQLIEVHLWLREELAGLREGVDAYFAGGARPRELRAHCLTFCSALTRHHTGEDDVAFPEVAGRFPELRPVLEELRRDHRLVEDSLRRLEALVAGLDEETDPAEVRREMDSLAALMETHFVYEEKRIVAALNALNVPDWDRSPPAFLLADDAER